MPGGSGSSVGLLRQQRRAAPATTPGRSGNREVRTDFNCFLSEHGSGCGGGLRITDIHGERLVVDGIALRPDAVQPTRVQFAAH
ncbi:hypothetical protein [Streptomyces sp. H51]|uniref:hypothetical protein n=1 Tax=Streptomyces sp. H51 TaxID=3111770 RepID=UPI002D78A60E|nr:hypothetical protein [Streptomyces sp. H51]